MESMLSMINGHKSAAIDRIYEDMIGDIRAHVDNYGGVTKFCSDNEIGRSNFNSILTGQREMSIGTYIRVLIGWGVVDETVVTGDQKKSNLPLKEYLKIDNNTIMQSLILITHS